MPARVAREFSPSDAEFNNFRKYYKSVLTAAEGDGICKIKPPIQWKAKISGSYEWDKLLLGTVRTQRFKETRNPYCFEVHATKDKTKRTCASAFSSIPLLPEELRSASLEDIDAYYWSKLTTLQPDYAVDIQHSFFDCDVGINLQTIRTGLQLCVQPGGKPLPGNVSPYCYAALAFGATFAIHDEDLLLPSINYLHYGAPKMWLSVPYSHHSMLQSSVVDALWPRRSPSLCKLFLKHKSLIINPKFLEEQGIPYTTTWQHAGEFVITFPGAPHQGYNLGPNFAEAVNFLDQGKLQLNLDAPIDQCKNKQGVSIDFTPAILKLWGEDYAKKYMTGKLSGCKDNQKLNGACGYNIKSGFLSSRINHWKEVVELDKKKGALQLERFNFNISKYGSPYSPCSMNVPMPSLTVTDNLPHTSSIKSIVSSTPHNTNLENVPNPQEPPNLTDLDNNTSNSHQPQNNTNPSNLDLNILSSQQPRKINSTDKGISNSQERQNITNVENSISNSHETLNSPEVSARPVQPSTSSNLPLASSPPMDYESTLARNMLKCPTPWCKKVFARKDSLAMHLKRKAHSSHIPGSPREFNCSICCLTFSHQGNLNRHLKTISHIKKQFGRWSEVVQNEIIEELYGIEQEWTKPLNFNPKSRPTRQSWSGKLVENGMFYFVTAKTISDGLIQGPRSFYYEIPKKLSLEIDSIEDLTYAEVLMMRNLTST